MNIFLHFLSSSRIFEVRRGRSCSKVVDPGGSEKQNATLLTFPQLAPEKSKLLEALIIRLGYRFTASSSQNLIAPHFPLSEHYIQVLENPPLSCRGL
jgi:hypothetical protein